METVVLVVHLILALCLIGVVLLQRSEGGGLGMGGGGGGVMSGRQAATALAKVTWIFAALFFITSISLTVIAARNSTTGSVMDQGTTSTAPAAPTGPQPVPQTQVPAAKDLLPPGQASGTTAPAGGAADAPATPPRAGN